jgi:hypothetical protein
VVHLWTKVLIASMLTITSICAIAKDGCAQIEKQLSLLSQDDLAKLHTKGFALIIDEPRVVPSVVISEKMIASCRNRYIAERYFQNKIDGRKSFPVSKKELSDARADVAKAVYYALAVKDIWDDGVSHEIFNTVSDDLLPDWVQWQREQLRHGYISEEYFTKRMFLNPDPSLRPLLNDVLKSTDSFQQIALMFFLKKNLGEKLDLQLIRRELDRGTIYGGGDVDKKTAIAHAIRILSKSGKVTLDDSWQFTGELYGNV